MNQISKNIVTCAIWITILSLLSPTHAVSSIPFHIAYQGIATDLFGNPKSNGVYDITFALYDDKTAGSQLWVEPKKATITNGMLSTMLGDTIPINLPFDKQYWLGIRIGTDPELTPRVKLSTAPYTFHAGKSDTAGVAVKAIFSDSAKGSVHAVVADSAIGSARTIKADSARISGNAHFAARASFSTIADSAKIAKEAYTARFIDGVNVKDSSITTAKIMDNAVTTLKIAENTIARNDVSTDFKAPYADTSDFARKLSTNGTGVVTDTAILTTLKAPQALYLLTRGIERIMIDTSGNVGIGTNVPGAHLDVAGNINSSGFLRFGNNIGAYINRTNSGGDTYGNDLTLTAAHSTNSVVARCANSFQVQTYSSEAWRERIRVTNNGNVGIGTTSPEYKLDISGTALVSRFGADPAAISIAGNAQVYIGGYYTANGSCPLTYLSNNMYYNGSWVIPDNTQKTTKLSLSNGNFYFSSGNNIGLCTEKVTILNTGNVGIGIDNPSEKLHVAGNILATGTITPSDRRYKTNITPIPSSLDKIAALEGVYYDWDRTRYPEKNFPSEKQIGLIAQDVEKVFPELVHTDSEGYKSMSYDKLTAVLIEAVKELKAQNGALQKRIEQLEQK